MQLWNPTQGFFSLFLSYRLWYLSLSVNIPAAGAAVALLCLVHGAWYNLGLHPCWEIRAFKNFPYCLK